MSKPPIRRTLRTVEGVEDAPGSIEEYLRHFGVLIEHYVSNVRAAQLPTSRERRKFLERDLK